MKCPKCQAEILDDSQFCSKCGTPIHPGDKAFLSHTHTILRPVDELVPGTELAGKYKIIDVVGKGGMGIVYKAEDIKLKRNVALKFLPPELTKDKEAKERFVIEAQAAAALSHTNICTIHEIGEEEGKSFIVMEYVEGESLKNKIDKGPIAIEKAVDVAVQVAQGMEQAHKKGIVHRDIKSANIMVTDMGQAKIMDFGLAKVKGGTLLTREGTTLGTVAYMSPEQARGEEVDYRTDIWSLGIVLYEMLSGQLPFMGDREASILYSVVHEEAKPVTAWNPDIPSDLQQIIDHTLKKKCEARYQSATELLKDLQKYKESLKAEELGAFSFRSFLHKIRKPIFVVPAILIIAAIAIAAFWLFSHQKKIRWAKEQAIPEIKGHISSDKFIDAYLLANQAEKYIPKSPELAQLKSQFAREVSIITDPEGAEIYFERIESTEDKLIFLGKSPLDIVSLPLGFFRIKMIKEGYTSVENIEPNYRPTTEKSTINRLNFVLDEKGKIPDDMVRIPAKDLSINLAGIDIPEVIPAPSYFIDKFEVTNKLYKEFIDNGGYENPEYWIIEFEKDGRVLKWEDAMDLFRDQTGRPGPSTWSGGIYQKDQEDFPVAGVSWYEAAAYAKYVGKSLPSIYHWLGAANLDHAFILIPQSNYSNSGPMRVGSYPAGFYGVYDMAGNVREWCWNRCKDQNYILGGAWGEASYMLYEVTALSPFDRSPTNGFRCVDYIDIDDTIRAETHKPVDIPRIDWRERHPVQKEIYQIYKSQYSYDEKSLQEKKISIDDSNIHWIKEKIEINTAYDNERLPIYVFLPKSVDPPFQTIVYFPGMSALLERTSDNLLGVGYFDFLIMSGRAFIYPVYKGTYERTIGLNTSNSSATRDYSNFLRNVVNDVSRAVDYVETRKDLDNKKIAYLGHSWGARIGSIILAVEDRFGLGLLSFGGFSTNPALPEAIELNFAPHVTIPILMINGKYDAIFPYSLSVQPMFDSFGTLERDKTLILLDGGHGMNATQRNTYMKHMLSWLDRYFGPVK